MASFGSTITFKTFITCPSHCFDWLYLVKRIILVLETSCINVKWNSIEPKFFWVGSFWYFCSIFKPAFEVLRCKKSLLVWVAITISLWVKKASHCFTWQTGWFELLLLHVTVLLQMIQLSHKVFWFLVEFVTFLYWWACLVSFCAVGPLPVGLLEPVW